ncbi:MAG: hypothetical protein KatS3mg035_2092 [Bacteroidia bacterium]|nr:MAG: hypothetical protein KatS3mg035_2092 [Bacteroidia bacterium]
MTKESDVVKAIQTYYLESERAYRNWGRDEERESVYALHGGFSPEGQNLPHYEEVKELKRQLIKFDQIPLKLDFVRRRMWNRGINLWNKKPAS